MINPLTKCSFALSLLVGALTLTGCAHGPCACTKPHAAMAPAVKAPGEAVVGDRSTCPVSGEEFTVTASSPTAVVDGKTYYFCCPGCDKKFTASPATYLKK